MFLNIFFLNFDFIMHKKTDIHVLVPNTNMD